MNWLISANENIFDVAGAFAHFESVDWRQGNTRYGIGDLVYIYSTSPVQGIRYKCRVTAIDKKSSECRDDKDFWIDKKEYEKALGRDLFFNLELLDEADSEKLSLPLLKENGLKAAPQGPMKLSVALESYISSIFSTATNKDFPETIGSPLEVFEGIKKQVTVNKYERSPIARARCIKVHGHTCKVCHFSFEEKYGDLGKDFIHVHHITPIHSIGKSYRIDYVNDLIPVCPNCHAMLHKQIDGKFYSVSELAELIEAFADSKRQEVAG